MHFVINAGRGALDRVPFDAITQPPTALGSIAICKRPHRRLCVQHWLAPADRPASLSLRKAASERIQRRGRLQALLPSHARHTVAPAAVGCHRRYRTTFSASLHREELRHAR